MINVLSTFLHQYDIRLKRRIDHFKDFFFYYIGFTVSEPYADGPERKSSGGICNHGDLQQLTITLWDSVKYKVGRCTDSLSKFNYTYIRRSHLLPNRASYISPVRPVTVFRLLSYQGRRYRRANPNYVLRLSTAIADVFVQFWGSETITGYPRRAFVAHRESEVSPTQNPDIFVTPLSFGNTW